VHSCAYYILLSKVFFHLTINCQHASRHKYLSKRNLRTKYVSSNEDPRDIAMTRKYSCHRFSLFYLKAIGIMWDILPKNSYTGEQWEHSSPPHRGFLMCGYDQLWLNSEKKLHLYWIVHTCHYSINNSVSTIYTAFVLY
jgi:hypothetical protein